MNIKPLHNNNDYEFALERAESLMEAKPGTNAGNELEILSILIDDYEKRHWPIKKPSAVAAILFCMDQNGLSQNDLVPYIGSKSKVSEVLSGKRNLSIAMMQRLHRFFGIPYDILMNTFDEKNVNKGPQKETNVTVLQASKTKHVGAVENTKRTQKIVTKAACRAKPNMQHKAKKRPAK